MVGLFSHQSMFLPFGWEQADRFLDELPVPPPAEDGIILVAAASSHQKVPVFEQKERPGNRRMATLAAFTR
ncbi:MAG: hypothetical protein U0793_24955 [Gemmataceae bacterium]